ncbi:MarR family winged helix-turn-helix transcriptional regulator [Sutcliffiella halmapala]|uniref:MarR family winged helix-turn-helix transcriptional regulator n=1 Tax=Sutcliffiella halmapala TaxID=79882 RepID=UPI0009951E60|nr:MarR family winged helix-turn-helix transcriptional regulator [Sutcliffiella halmapala]
MNQDKEYLLDDSLGYKLFHASRLMNNRINQHFKDKNFPVTHEQWQILSRLYETDGLTQNKIAELNERDQPSVSRLIDNMIKRGLVKRVAHPTDARINLIYLTEEAKRKEEELTSIAMQTIKDATKDLPQIEVEQCLALLDRIRDNLKA